MRFRAEICVTKEDIMWQFQLSPKAARGRIQRAVKTGSLLPLRRGLYLNARAYTHESDRVRLTEFIASKLYLNSYISLEYVLHKYQILSDELPPLVTCVTTGQTRYFENFAGSFIYRNIKEACYFGFEEVKFHNQTYCVATKAKALFDYLYLRPEFGSRSEKYLRLQLFKKSPFQWVNFSEEDFKQFEEYVWKSNSFKMMRLRRVIEEYFENKKFDAWRKELLG